MNQFNINERRSTSINVLILEFVEHNGTAINNRSAICRLPYPSVSRSGVA